METVSLKRALLSVWNGRGLTHTPIDWDGDQHVRIAMRSASLKEPLDVSYDHVPVSLRPLILGVRADGVTDDERDTEPVTLELTDARDHARFGSITAVAAGSISLSTGRLRFLRPVGCHNSCDPLLSRWWRYALAWRHAQRSDRRDDRLRMSASDLRTLNLYYSAARPVYLVGVSHERRSNLFPMDLVGRLSSGDFLLALRSTSPAVALIEQSRKLALSAAPADRLRDVYALGAHHHRDAVDTSALSFVVEPSPTLGLPSVSGRVVYELVVDEVHPVGSHALFVARVVAGPHAREHQLAHVSAMYLRWAGRRGSTFVRAPLAVD